MSNNFYVGQRVVCVKRGQWVYDRDGSPSPGLPYGRVFTINHISDGYLGFVEVGLRSAYLCSNFRPAVDNPCDISVFKKMLTNTKVTV